MGGHVGPVVQGAWISSLTYISQLYPFLSGLRKTDWKSSTHTKIIKPNKHGKMVLGTQQACVLPRLERVPAELLLPRLHASRCGDRSWRPSPKLDLTL